MRNSHGGHSVADCGRARQSRPRAPADAAQRGFWFVDALARRHGAQFRSHARYQGEIAKVTHRGHGARAAQAADVHEPQRPLDPRAHGLHQGAGGEILVVHDELDLPCGVARLKLGGGHGGHNGMRDTITHCGAGLLAPAPRHRSSGRQVAGDRLRAAARASGRGERDRRQRSTRASSALSVFLRDGAEKAMHQLHSAKAPDTGKCLADSV